MDLLVKLLDYYRTLEEGTEGNYKYYVPYRLVFFEAYKVPEDYNLFLELSHANLIGLKSKLNEDDAKVLVFLLGSIFTKNMYLSYKYFRQHLHNPEGLDQTEDISYWIRAIKEILNYSIINSYDKKPEIKMNNNDMKQTFLKANKIKPNLIIHKHITLMYEEK